MCEPVPALIEVDCPRCHGDGGWSIPVDIDRRHGGLIERVEACDACEGTGTVWVESEPVTEEETMEPL